MPTQHMQITNMRNHDLPNGSTYPPAIEMRAFRQGGVDVLRDQDFNEDLERKMGDEAHLFNDTVHTFLWQEVTVTVKDHRTGRPKAILDNVQGIVKAGELCALMGPSGCGKTTLLNVLAHRDAAPGGRVDGVSLVNGSTLSEASFRRLTCYVEQDDALIGSLTVRETMHFAARLAHRNALKKADRITRIDSLIDSFGLRGQEYSLIGTPLRKGISGGQKRRLSVASQLITSPKILFLDEPTSGLDSAASYEVIAYIKEVAKRNNLIVVASIHQPSTSTFEMFDKLLLLSGGKQHYFGSVEDVGPHFETLGYPMPIQMNPAEFILDLMNVDFAHDSHTAHQRLHELQQGWYRSSKALDLTAHIRATSALVEPPSSPRQPGSSLVPVVMSLVHRSFIKSYRDVVAYGIRLAMYSGLAIMMGTVWLRLDTVQDDIQPYINAIFFSSAFMSFMAVAYVPSFLEDRSTFVKERANGLYGPTAFMLSNFIIGLPYLLLMSVLFSVIAYWLVNFRPTGQAFFTFVMWLFLDLVAAESLVVLVSTIAPVFVISLAVTAFANGLWMSVGGFLVPPKILNVFWRYAFHYIDYQTYVFQGLMVNEFSKRNYACGADGHCLYQTELASKGQISGRGILDQYGYKEGHTAEWVGILLAIVTGYRLLGLLAMYVRK